MSAIATSLGFVLLPIALGAGLGFVLRAYNGRRFRGVLFVLLFLLGPIALGLPLAIRFPLLGIWDAGMAAAFVGMGLLATAHAALRETRGLALSGISLTLSLLALEAACRLFLPPAPGFPGSDSPHLWLSEALYANARNHSWGLQSKELVATAIYGDDYRGVLDVREIPDILLPHRFQPKADGRRVLHVGDSMTFGMGVERDRTFTAVLEGMEPGTQHINAGIPGTAPDAYYLLLRRWLDLHAIDEVIVYVFEGNDVIGIGEAYPCCAWKSLLLFDSKEVVARCPTVPKVDLGSAGSHWILYNSPPPYLLRVAIPFSSAAAHLGSAIVGGFVLQNLIEVETTMVQQMAQLDAILATMAGDLKQRRIPISLVVIPTREWLQDPLREHAAATLAASSRSAGIPTLDLSDGLLGAVGTEDLFLPNDSHFSAAGHRRVAALLHAWRNPR